MSKRNRHSSRRPPRRPPASGRKPTGRLTSRDIMTSADQLLGFQAHFESLFQRREQRDWFLFYMCGQLSNLERKTIEPMVLALIGDRESAIRTLQHFMGQVVGRARWRLDCGRERLSQARRSLGRRGLAILWSSGQVGQLSARGVCRLCQSSRLRFSR